MKKVNIIFFGTAAIAKPCLLNLDKKKYSIVAIVTQPDKPQGKHQEIFFNPIKELAIDLKKSVIQTPKITMSDIDIFQAELGILFAYGQIIPNNVIKSFKYGIINIHPSLLPKYRGPSPIQTAILNNDTKTGITLMKLDEKMDTGPIIAQSDINICANDNTKTLTKKIADLAPELLLKNIDDYISGKIIPKEQNNSVSSYSRIIKKSDGQISVTDNPMQIMQKYKAFISWPGIFFIHKKIRYKIIAMHLSKRKIIIDQIQPEGKKIISWNEFKKGYQNIINELSL